MAIGVLLDIPGGTQEQYDALNEKAFGNPKGPAQIPAGAIVHTAGPTPSGFRVFDVWESREDFQRFTDELIMPAAMALGMPPVEPQVYELTNLMHGE